ncbi:MAG: hypothetical protein V1729_03915 [Candidatus Woesearchaeota archaeon]
MAWRYDKNMETDLKPRKLHNLGHVDDKRFRQLQVFSDALVARYPKAMASIIVKRPVSVSADLEVLLVVDDLNDLVVAKKVSDMRIAASELAFSKDLPIRCDAMHASDLWKGFQSYDHDALQIFRESLMVHDNGFFAPLQELLITGKMRPSKESVNIYFIKAERSIKNANGNVAKAVLDLYWAVIDSAHAAVMVAGITPPSPKDLADTVKRELVLRNLVHKRCGEIVERFYDIAKKIMHKEVIDISGKEFDSYLHDADFFMKEIDKFVREHVK